MFPPSALKCADLLAVSVVPSKVKSASDDKVSASDQKVTLPAAPEPSTVPPAVDDIVTVPFDAEAIVILFPASR